MSDLSENQSLTNIKSSQKSEKEINIQENQCSENNSSILDTEFSNVLQNESATDLNECHVENLNSDRAEIQPSDNNLELLNKAESENMNLSEVKLESFSKTNSANISVDLDEIVTTESVKFNDCSNPNSKVLSGSGDQNSNDESSHNELNQMPQTWRNRNNSSSSDCSTGSEDITILEQMEVITSPPSTVPQPKHVRTKGEITMDDLPPVEYLSISAEDRVELVLLGDVSSVIDKIVVIEALPNLPPLDMDSALFFKDRRVFGQVFETLGRVSSPFYIVRFNCKEDIATQGIVPGISVYYAANETAYSKFVLPKDIQSASKGSDASWKDNNEPPISQLEFSDDEEERQFRRKLKNKDGPESGSKSPNPIEEESTNLEINQLKRPRTGKVRKNKKFDSNPQSMNQKAARNNKCSSEVIRSNKQTGNWFSHPNSQQCMPPGPPPYVAMTSSAPSYQMYNASQYSQITFPNLSLPPPPIFTQSSIPAPNMNFIPPFSPRFESPNRPNLPAAYPVPGPSSPFVSNAPIIYRRT